MIIIIFFVSPFKLFISCSFLPFVFCVVGVYLFIPKFWLRKTSPKYKEEEQTRERFEVSSQPLKYGGKD
jgi:hypothetical protein